MKEAKNLKVVRVPGGDYYLQRGTSMPFEFPVRATKGNSGHIQANGLSIGCPAELKGKRLLFRVEIKEVGKHKKQTGYSGTKTRKAD